MKRPQFMLRDLLWLMVVVGLAVGWWIDHQAVWPRLEKSERHARTLEMVLEGLRSP